MLFSCTLHFTFLINGQTSKEVNENTVKTKLRKHANINEKRKQKDRTPQQKNKHNKGKKWQENNKTTKQQKTKQQHMTNNSWIPNEKEDETRQQKSTQQKGIPPKNVSRTDSKNHQLKNLKIRKVNRFLVLNQRIQQWSSYKVSLTI